MLISHRGGRQTGETISWFHAQCELSNQHCLDCGCDLSAESIKSDKEHWIARNFVPKGTMTNGAFNFIFRACRHCNARKCNAERHVSSVTLFNGPGRHEDPRAALSANRKAANDFHPEKPGCTIGESHDQHTVRGTFGRASISFGFVSPPRVYADSIKELSLSQIQGLFSLITTEDYRDSAKMRLLPEDQFFLFNSFPLSDWGNPQLVELSRRVNSWECLANITSADGYFRVTVRRNGLQGWFWALEWNKFLRVIGGIAIGQSTLFQALPDLEWQQLSEGKSRFREEVAFTEHEDILFGGTCE